MRKTIIIIPFTGLIYTGGELDIKNLIAKDFVKQLENLGFERHDLHSNIEDILSNTSLLGEHCEDFYIFAKQPKTVYIFSKEVLFEAVSSTDDIIVFHKKLSTRRK